jgi:hypothetical protein
MKTKRFLYALIPALAAFTNAAAGQPLVVHPNSLPVVYGAKTDTRGIVHYYAIFPASGTVRELGPTAFVVPQDAAYDPIKNVRYSIFRDEQGTTNLYATDGETGVTSSLGSVDISFMHSAPAYDTATGMLYVTTGSAFDPNYLWRIDPGTRQTSFVGAIGYPGVGAFGWDRRAGVLYSATANPDVLTIDVTSGQGSLFVTVDTPESFSFQAPAVDPLGLNLYVLGYDAIPGGSYPPTLFVYAIADGHRVGKIPLRGDISNGNGPGVLFFHQFR